MFVFPLLTRIMPVVTEFKHVISNIGTFKYGFKAQPILKVNCLLAVACS